MVNTLLNIALIGPVIKRVLNVKQELKAAAAGTAASALGGGYSNYIAVRVRRMRPRHPDATVHLSEAPHGLLKLSLIHI